MKKILCFIITASLLLSSSSMAFAKQSHVSKQNQKSYTSQQVKDTRVKEKKQSFKIAGTPVIKYGRYKLPINPIVKGMGATVTFDKATAVLTVNKGTNTIVINFIQKTVSVNGVADTNSGIFNAKNDKKMTVLIKYIGIKLGVRVNVDKDQVTTVTITPSDETPISTELPSAVSGSAITIK